MDEMEAALSKSPWLAGDEYSLADISITPYIQRFEANELTRLIDWTVRPRSGNVAAHHGTAIL